jgi:hypothetical protein
MKTSHLILLVTILIYLAISFITWQINPAYWTKDIRGFFIFSFVFGNIIGLVVNQMAKDLSK